MTCRVRTSQSTSTKSSARHRSTALLLRERWEKGGKKWWKVEQKMEAKAWKKHFVIGFCWCFYLFWMLHCIYLQLLYLHVFTYVYSILSLSIWISNTVNPRWINSIGPANHFQSKPEQTPVSCSMFQYVSFIDQLIENQWATNTGWHFLAPYHGSMFSWCPMVSPWHLDVSWIAWCFH